MAPLFENKGVIKHVLLKVKELVEIQYSISFFPKFLRKMISGYRKKPNMLFMHRIVLIITENNVCKIVEHE